MKWANESVEQRHRQRRRESCHQRRESPRRLVGKPPRKTTPHEWRPPEPRENGKRIVYGRLRIWNGHRWDDAPDDGSKRGPHEWRPPERKEHFKRVVRGRPHTWNESRKSWVEDRCTKKKGEAPRLDNGLSRPRKRSRSSTPDRDNASRNFFSYAELERPSEETEVVKKRVRISDDTKTVDGGQPGQHEIRGNDSTTKSFESDDMRDSQNVPKMEMDTSSTMEIDSPSNLQIKVDNLEEENAMWKRRYERLRQEYEEQMKLKYDSEHASNSQLQDPQSEVTKAKADREKESILSGSLRKDMVELETDLAIQTNEEEDQQKCTTRLKHEKEELEGKIEDLESDNQVYATRLEAVKLELANEIENSRASDDRYQKSLQKILQGHRTELEEARALVSKQTTSVNNNEATMKWKAEFESKTKECVDIQNNFNTIAMQSVKQSNTIEEQRRTIHRLRLQLDAAMGNEKVPLKVEDC